MGRVVQAVCASAPGYVKGSVLDTIRSLVKFNFGVGTRDVVVEYSL